MHTLLKYMLFIIYLYMASKYISLDPDILVYLTFLYIYFIDLGLFLIIISIHFIYLSSLYFLYVLYFVVLYIKQYISQYLSISDIVHLIHSAFAAYYTEPH